MKNIILLFAFTTLLAGCGTYKIKEGQAKAELLVEAHDLRRVGRMRDDIATIELYEKNNLLGHYTVSVHAKTKLFYIPANILTSIKAIQNMAKFGAVTKCIIPVKISPKENERYKLTLNYSQWKSTCKATLYRHNGIIYVALSELVAKDEGAVVTPRQF